MFSHLRLNEGDNKQRVLILWPGLLTTLAGYKEVIIGLSILYLSLSDPMLIAYQYIIVIIIIQMWQWHNSQEFIIKLVFPSILTTREILQEIENFLTRIFQESY